MGAVRAAKQRAVRWRRREKLLHPGSREITAVLVSDRHTILYTLTAWAGETLVAPRRPYCVLRGCLAAPLRVVIVWFIPYDVFDIDMTLLALKSGHTKARRVSGMAGRTWNTPMELGHDIYGQSRGTSRPLWPCSAPGCHRRHPREVHRCRHCSCCGRRRIPLAAARCCRSGSVKEVMCSW